LAGYASRDCSVVGVVAGEAGAGRGAADAKGESIISTAETACTVRVVVTDEDLMIARHAKALLSAASHS
jgi:acetate kinase